MKAAKLAVMIFALSALPVFGQTDTTAVEQGQTVKVVWQATPDTDVIAYRLLIFSPDSSLIKSNRIDYWIASGADDASYSPLDVSLEPGLYFVQMTAIDRAGNESVPSNKAWMRVINKIPAQPLILYIRVVP